VGSLECLAYDLDAQSSPVQSSVATLEMEANLSLHMQMTTLAMRLTGRGWQLHDHRCQPPY
jgi:hypothetical protein